jgi:hypothetical protein
VSGPCRPTGPVSWSSIAASSLARLALGGLLAAACGPGQGPRPADGVHLDQRVTTQRVRRDAAFADFETHWQRFVSPSPDLARAVSESPGGTQERWAPTSTAACQHSTTAGGLVPLVMLTWSDPTPGAAEAPPRLRVDLAVHHRGFERALYSSAVLDDRQDRLLLPSTSGLVADPDALLLTGPVLFPTLVDDNAVAPTPGRHEIGLRDLGEGLTYAVRLSRWDAGAWIERGRTLVLVPVCAGGGQ